MERLGRALFTALAVAAVTMMLVAFGWVGRSYAATPIHHHRHGHYFRYCDYYHERPTWAASWSCAQWEGYYHMAYTGLPPYGLGR